MEELKG